MQSGRRIRRVLVGVALVAIPLFGQLPVSASTTSGTSPTASSMPFHGIGTGPRGLHGPLTPSSGESPRIHVLTRAVTPAADRGLVPGALSRSGMSGSDPARTHKPGARSTRSLSSSTPPTELTGFQGTDQSSAITHHGDDQLVTPPDPDLAAGPTQVVETTNSTIYVFSRTGGYEFSFDFNTFLNGSSANLYQVTDPRVMYDKSSGRFFISDLDIYEPANSCGNYPDFDVVLVSPSSTLSSSDNWYGFYWSPYANNPDGLFADQPGLGISSNLVAATQNAYGNCAGDGFVEAELLVVQKSDLLNRTFGGASSSVNFPNLPFAPQPVQELGANAYQYVVFNETDTQPTCTGCVGVLEVHGTPRAGNVAMGPAVYEPMTPTLTQCTSSQCSTPPADQPGTVNQLETDDDRFLNAVWYNNTIWTAGNTTCTPTGDTSPRSCLDLVSVGADASGNVTAGTQINNVGVVDADLFYPAVSIDSAGNVIAVFDESSSAADESVLVAAIDSGTSTLTNFTTLHQSLATYANGCTGSLCRWGDYSGAAVDPSNPADVWVVSEDADGNTTSTCITTATCWNTYIGRYSFAAPTITSVVPASGPVAGGQSVTINGTDFIAGGTTVTLAGSSVTPTSVTPDFLTLLTPPSSTLAGGTVQIQATDSLGITVETAASAYTYVGLANYAPVTPFRILDTRNTGGPIGQGLVRALQVTGGAVPSTATAAVLNVTEVYGSASSLLTVYPFNATRPNASNLNFQAHTVIANLVTVTLGANAGQGWINIYNGLGSVNVVVDVEGYFTRQPSTDVQGLFHPILPVRVCDTRTSCQGHGAVGAGQSIVVSVASAGVPSDGSAEAAVVNLTGVAGNASTYLSLFPTDLNGHCTPTGTSTINLLPGVVRANRVMVELGPTTTGGNDDALCVYNAAGTINVLVDANGWYGSAAAAASATGYQYQALEPTRICDTRVVSASCASGAIGAGSLQRLITVAGREGVPSFASLPVVAIIANLTAVAPTVRTYLTLYPASRSSPPTVSDLNVEVGAVLANEAVVQVDTIAADPHDGEVYLYNGAGSVNAIIDLEGWFQ